MLTIDTIKKVGIPKNVNKLNNLKYTPAAIYNDSVNLYDAIMLVLEANNINPSSINFTGVGVDITGNYPNFTITNTSPASDLVLNAGQNVSITGVYPEFTISASGTPSSDYPIKTTAVPSTGSNIHVFNGVQANLTKPIDVYLNGVLKTLTEDYTIQNAPYTAVVFNYPFKDTDKLTLRYYN